MYPSDLKAIEARIDSLSKGQESRDAELAELRALREELLSDERRKSPKKRRSSLSRLSRVRAMVRTRVFIVLVSLAVPMGVAFLIGNHEVSQSEQLRLNRIEQKVVIVDRVSNESNHSFLVSDPQNGRFQVEVDRDQWQEIDVNTTQYVTVDPDDFSNRSFGLRADVEKQGLAGYLAIGFAAGLFFLFSLYLAKL